MKKQEDNIEDKKMRKEEMENDNVVMYNSLQKIKMRKEVMENNNMVMCHSLQKKQRENTEEIGTTSSLHHTH